MSPTVRTSDNLSVAWHPAPACPGLAGHDLHVWRADLPPAESGFDRLDATLSAEERRRADRFLFERHRRNYVGAHGILRDVLSRYLERRPADLAFAAGPHGKPALEGAELRFNLSHCDDMVLIAVTPASDVGIDVERLRPMDDIEDLAARFLAPGERREILALPPALRERGFFTAWTRKEAYLKASGEGLGRPLDSFEVTATPGSPPRLLSGSPVCAFRDIALDHDHLGAAAVLGPIGDMRRFLWPGPRDF